MPSTLVPQAAARHRVRKYIDGRIRQYHAQSLAAQRIDRPPVARVCDLLINELLDARNALTGVPR